MLKKEVKSVPSRALQGSRPWCRHPDTKRPISQVDFFAMEVDFPLRARLAKVQGGRDSR